MNAPLLEPPVTRWECHHCSFTDCTREVEPHSRFHHCAGLGITAPMVPEGTRARVVAHERDDYINGDLVRFNDDGRPIASITTEYPDGHQDCVVFAATAQTGSSAKS